MSRRHHQVWIGNVVLAIFQRIAPRIQFRAALQRNPEIGRPAAFDAFKALRRNADDRDRHAIHIQRLSQHVRVARKPPRPVVVADHGNGRMVRLVLFAEAAAARQLHAQAGEERAAHHVAFRFFRLRSVADCDLAARQRHVSHHRRERPGFAVAAHRRPA